MGLIATSLAFQVTGVNDKINQAASRVFGDDLVKVGNLAALAYGTFSEGGFDLGNVGEAGAEAAGTVASAGAESAAAAPLPTETVNYSDFSSTPQGTGALQAPTVSAPGSTDYFSGAKANWPSGAQAADAGTGLQMPTPPTPGASPTWPAMRTAPLPDIGAGQDSGMAAFLKRQLLDNDGRIRNSALALGGNVITGLGTGYLSYRQRQALEDEARRREAIANTGLAGWRQTN